jgi:hypothetical protein
LDALSEGARRANKGSVLDSKKWSALHLETASHNTISPVLESKGGLITKLTIEQAPLTDKHPTLRDHFVEIALFDLDPKTKSPILREKTLKVRLQPAKETDVKEAVGLKAPAAIYINYQDHAFVKASVFYAFASFFFLAF